jgi:hypothetical protein
VTSGRTDEELRALAREILAREEYAQWRSFTAAGFDELVDWFAEWIDGLRLLADTSPILYGLMLLGLALVAAALVAHIVWSVRVAMRVSAAAADRGVRTAPRRDFVVEAQELAGAGDFLAAARRLQLAVLRLLVERDYVELARHEPNSVLRRRVQQAAGLPEEARAELRARIRELERSWFRDRSGDRALYQSWTALYARLDALGDAP